MTGWRKRQIKEHEMTDREVLIERLATTCLGLDAVDPLRLLVDDVIAALAQPEQEPVAWPCEIDSADFSKGTITVVMQCEDFKVSAGTHWLSTQSLQRTWVSLSDEDRNDCLVEADPCECLAEPEAQELMRCVENKSKEMNHGK
jgi:hypothetical protein